MIWKNLLNTTTFNIAMLTAICKIVKRLDIDKNISIT